MIASGLAVAVRRAAVADTLIGTDGGDQPPGHARPRPALRRGRRRPARGPRRERLHRGGPRQRHGRRRRRARPDDRRHRQRPIDGGVGGDVVYAGAGDDLVLGGAGADTLFGQDGSDQLFGGLARTGSTRAAAQDFVDAGSDDDTVYADGTGITLLGGRRRRRDHARRRRHHCRGRRRARPHPHGRRERPRVRRALAATRSPPARGNDRIEAADGRRDRVHCGPGEATGQRRTGSTS